MILMVKQQGFFKKWFPTLVGIFQHFQADVQEVKSLSTKEVHEKTVEASSFFIQGIDDSDIPALFSREQLLTSLEWIKPIGSLPTYVSTTVETEIAIQEPEAMPLLMEVDSLLLPIYPIPTVKVTEVAADEDTGFFIRGLGIIDQLESFKNTDLLALLTWEEQGQTLLEVDPDDYELLDDLLDTVDI